VNAVEWLDRGTENLLAGLHQPWLDALLTAVTWLGDRIVLAIVVLAAVAVLLARRLRRAAFILMLTALAGFPLSEGVKVLMHRQRPDVPWRVITLPSSWSFPSGHALESTAVYGTLALVVGRRLRARRWRAAVFALGVALPLLIGFSRVYLGVHYLSDVLAGWAGGLILVLLAAWADRRRDGSFSRDPEGSARRERSPPGRG
jgi:undecaprenyl-diphosphatase